MFELPSELDSNVYVSESLLGDRCAQRVQDLLVRAAPKWTRGLHNWEYRQPKRPVDAGTPGALLREIIEEGCRRGPHYHELVRRYGPGKYERRTGAVELRGATRGLTVVVFADEYQLKGTNECIKWANSVDLCIERERVEGIPAARWNRMVLEKYCQSLPVPYARGNWSREFEAKNISREGGGYAAIGIDIARYLPGLYWLNFFGRMYCDLMGRNRLLSAPAYAAREVRDGVLLCLHEDPRAWNTAEYQATEARVLDHLGREYFFSRDNPERPTLAPDLMPWMPATMREEYARRRAELKALWG